MLNFIPPSTLIYGMYISATVCESGSLAVCAYVNIKLSLIVTVVLLFDCY